MTVTQKDEEEIRSLRDHQQSGRRHLSGSSEPPRGTRESAPETYNTEVRTVRRNWTSSSPSPPSPMMSRPEGPGLKSKNKRKGTQAGRAGWGRVGVGGL